MECPAWIVFPSVSHFGPMGGESITVKMVESVHPGFCATGGMGFGKSDAGHPIFFGGDKADAAFKVGEVGECGFVPLFKNFYTGKRDVGDFCASDSGFGLVVIHK